MLTGLTNSSTLGEARDWVLARREDGVQCPCCGQLAKVYTRKLNKAMARDLVWLVKMYYALGQNWVDLSKGPKALHVSRELAKLVHWNLIEMLHVPSDKGAKTSGKWRPTELGILFAKNYITLQSHIRLYDGNFLGFTGERLNIKQAMPFDYEELWNTHDT